MVITILSWLVIAGFLVLVGIGLRTGLAWAAVPEAGSPRTEFGGLSLIYAGVIFLFAWLAPSANPVFGAIASGGQVIGTILLLVGLALRAFGRAPVRI
jgi:hypothetical protein